MLFGNKRYVNGEARADADTSAQVETKPLAVAVVPDNRHGNTTTEIARFMPVMDIEQAVARRNVMVRAMKELMVEGVDYGKIPNCGDKPTLMQPGADKLANLFGLTLQYDFLEKIEDWTGAEHGGEPFFYYQIRAKVFRGEFLLAEGIGAASSWESKYRWRQSERTCPNCQKATIIKGREEYGGGWVCYAKKGGCGAKFYDGDQSIEGQQTGRKPNPDVADVVNTVLKIAYKRCKLHGTINGTSASEFFTQDLEDFSVTDAIDIGGNQPNTRQAAQYVAQQKVQAKSAESRNVPWRNMREMAEAFKAIREKVGELAYRDELERWGWTGFQDLRNAIDSRDKVSHDRATQKAVECYWHLDAIAREDK